MKRDPINDGKITARALIRITANGGNRKQLSQIKGLWGYAQKWADLDTQQA